MPDTGSNAGEPSSDRPDDFNDWDMDEERKKFDWRSWPEDSLEVPPDQEIPDLNDRDGDVVDFLSIAKINIEPNMDVQEAAKAVCTLMEAEDQYVRLMNAKDKVETEPLPVLSIATIEYTIRRFLRELFPSESTMKPPSRPPVIDANLQKLMQQFPELAAQPPEALAELLRNAGIGFGMADAPEENDDPPAESPDKRS